MTSLRQGSGRHAEALAACRTEARSAKVGRLASTAEYLDVFEPRLDDEMDQKSNFEVVSLCIHRWDIGQYAKLNAFI